MTGTLKRNCERSTGQTHYNLPNLLSVEDLFQEVGVQSGLEALGGDAPFPRVPLEQAQRHPPQRREVLRRVTLPDAAGVLPERDIQLPRQTVLDPPMAPQRPPVGARPGRLAADEAAHLLAALAPDRPLAAAGADRPQPRPGLPVPDPRGVPQDDVTAPLLPAVPGLHRHVHRVL